MLFQGLTSLQYIALNSNQLSRHIPPDLFKDQESLIQVDLSHNLLQGGIPKDLFSDLTELIGVGLSSNQLIGSIPKGLFSDLKTLTVVDLSDNQLSGSIPEDLFSGLTDLERVDLSANQLEGELPSMLFQNSKSLVRIALYSNHLSGAIPPNLFKDLVNLAQVDLESNRLSYELPPDLFKSLRSIETIWLNNNRLNGRVPDELFKDLNNLRAVYFGGNFLYGEVPTHLCDGTQFLDVASDITVGAFICCKADAGAEVRGIDTCEQNTCCLKAMDTDNGNDNGNEDDTVDDNEDDNETDNEKDDDKDEVTECLANGKYCCGKGEGLLFATGTCAECSNSEVCHADAICCNEPGYACAENGFCEPRQPEPREEKLAPLYIGVIAVVLFAVVIIALFLRHVDKKKKTCIRLDLPALCQPVQCRPDNAASDVPASADKRAPIGTVEEYKYPPAYEIKEDCKCNRSGLPLHQKCYLREYDDGYIELKEDVDLAAVDCAGRTLLHLAIQMEIEALLNALLNHKKLKTIVHIVDKEGRTPLHYACHVAGKSSVAVVEELLKFAGSKKASVKIERGQQKTSQCSAFHSAMRRKVAAVCKLLRKTSSNQVPTVRLVDDHGWAALQLAFYMPPPTQKDNPDAKAAEEKRRLKISYMLLECYPKEVGELLSKDVGGARSESEEQDRHERRVCDLLEHAMREAKNVPKKRHAVSAILERCPDIDYSNAMQSMAYCLAAGALQGDEGDIESGVPTTEGTRGAKTEETVNPEAEKEANLREAMKDVIWQATDAYDFTEGMKDFMLTKKRNRRKESSDANMQDARLPQVMTGAIREASDFSDFIERMREFMQAEPSRSKEMNGSEIVQKARQVIEEMIAEHKNMKELLDGDASFGVWSIMFTHPTTQPSDGNLFGSGNWSGSFIKFTCALTLLSQLAISVVLFVGLIDVQLQAPHIEGLCPLRVYEPDFDERNKCWSKREFKLDAVMQRLLICAISVLYLSRFQMLYTRKVLSAGTLSKGQLKAIEVYNNSKLGQSARWDEAMDIVWEGTVYVMNLLFLLSTNSILEMVLNSLALEFVANLDNEYKEHYMKVYGTFIRGVIRRKQLLDPRKTKSTGGNGESNQPELTDSPPSTAHRNKGGGSTSMCQKLKMWWRALVHCSTSMPKKWENRVGYGMWDSFLRLFMVLMLFFFSMFIFYSPICKFQPVWKHPPDDESYLGGCRKMSLF
ncbi:unnamed protein product [Chrysoparadoxa australica]